MVQITIVNGAVVATKNNIVIAQIANIQQVINLQAENDYEVYCSSSIDFPEEYTDDPRVIELCHKIRTEMV